MRLTNPHNQRPTIILDASAVGPRSEAAAKFKSPSATQTLLGVFRSYGHVAVDTARPASEALLGETDLADWALLDTTLPSESAKVAASIETSLDALCVQRLRVAYLSPYADAGVDQSKEASHWREACAAVHEARKVDELGLSQMSATDVEAVAQLCSEEGWLKPTVYRDTYNAAVQDIELQILPTLREHGIRLYARDPFSGGLFDNEGEEPTEAPAAVAKVMDLAKVQSINPRALALRWLLHHSALNERMGDALILPATELGQLEDDLRACDDGPLPADLVEGIEEWHSTATNARAAAAEKTTETIAYEAIADSA